MNARVLVAMVTPFHSDGSLDVNGAQALAARLVDEQGCDGLVVNGTTGEAPTTTDREKETFVTAVVDAVGDRATVIAGAGSFDTAHAVELARTAERAGAHGLLVVTPYYSRPSQDGIEKHFTTVADATGLPVTVYDIPARTGVAVEAETMLRLAAHPRITSVKDAAYDLLKSTEVMSATNLRYYSGADELNLPLYAIGAKGVISTIGHVAGAHIRAMLDAFDKGETGEATRIHQRLHPLAKGMMTRAQGAVTAKALTRTGPVRPPLVDATPELVEALNRDLLAAGITPGE
jgi:4-hydroxy-tetrahydrodipicolinate synthase